MKLITPFGIRKYSKKVSSNGYERIYHNHIRKCAGTSINKAMIKGMGGDENSYEELSNFFFHKMYLKHGPVVGWNISAINRNSFYFGFSHEPLHKLKLEESTFVFSFIRDPIDRVISHFNMLKDAINTQLNHPMLRSESKWAFGDFNHFIKNVPKKYLCAQLYNFSETYNIEDAIDTIERSVNYIGDIYGTENNLVPFLSSEFNLDIKYKHLRKSKSKTQLNKKQYEEVKSLLYEEILFYNRVQNKYGLNVFLK